MSFTLRMMTKEKKEKKIPRRHRHPPARTSLSPATSQTLQCIAYSHFCSTSSRLRKSPVICSISKPPPTRPLPPPPASNTTTLQTNDFLSQSPSSVRDTQSTFLANKRPLRTVTHWGKCVKESRFSIERGRSYILFVHSFIYLFIFV